MEYTVHKCRFSDWKPTAIRSIASDPFSTLVAVGREDGDVEISDSSNKWFVQARIAGMKDGQLRQLVFAKQASEAGRLFGASLRGVLFECDFGRTAIRHVRDSYGGAVWSMVAHDRQPWLVVGCEDGAARVFTYENGGLEYVRSYPTTGSRVLSVALHPTLPQLFLGCADGTIRCLDESSGKTLYRLTGDLVRGTPTHIWSLLVLSDSTVVSGDNRGHIQFWDGTTGVLMTTVCQHAADVLCLATDRDHNQVFASGVDSKVVCVRRISAAFDPTAMNDIAERLPSHSQWVYTTAHRPHSHDVYALALCARGEGTSNDVLLSGGIDTKLCVYSTHDFMKKRPVWVLPTPARGIVSADATSSRIAVRYSKWIDLWQTESIQKSSATKVADSEGTSNSNQGVQLDSRIHIRGAHFIQSFALSSTGSLLAVSSAEGTRLWFIDSDKPAEDTFVPVELPDVLASQTCTALRFSGDDKSLVAAFSAGDGSHVCLLDVQWPSDATSTTSMGQATPGKGGSSKKKQKNNEGAAAPAPSSSLYPIAPPTVSVRYVFNHSRSVREAVFGPAALKKSSAPIYKSKIINDLENVCSSCSFSADGQWLAVASGGTRVYVYEIDRLKLHWALPAFTSPVTSVSFHPTAHSSVVITLADNTFWMFDASSLTVAPWSAQYTDKIPSAVKAIAGPVEGATFDVNRPSSIILFGQGFLVFVDLNEAIPDAPKRVTPMNASANIQRRPQYKRKNAAASAQSSNNGTHTNRNFAIVSTYRSLIHVNCTTASQLVVLENPWVQVLDGLPDTLARERYGT